MREGAFQVRLMDKSSRLMAREFVAPVGFIEILRLNVFIWLDAAPPPRYSSTFHRP